MRKFLFALVLVLGGCANLPGLSGQPLTDSQRLAAAQSTAEVVFDQATELRLDGFISDSVWSCIKQISKTIDSALSESDIRVASSQTRLLRRAAREDFNACN